MRGLIPTWILAAACALTGLAVTAAALGSFGKCIAFTIPAVVFWAVLIIVIRAVDRR